MDNCVTHLFTCPKCGGHHFGSILKNKEIIGVACHNADDGKPLLDFFDWVDSGMPKQKPCNWKGTWDEAKIVGCDEAQGEQAS